MKRIASFAIVLVSLFAATTPAQAAGPIDSYCSPTGDYCQGLYRQNGIRAKLSTFSFRGRYEICVGSRQAGRECKEFRLRRDGNCVYQGSVGLARHFNIRAPGRYAVTWKFGGNRLGKKLQFRK